MNRKSIVFVLDKCFDLTDCQSLVSIGSLLPKAMTTDDRFVKGFGHSSAADGSCCLLSSDQGLRGGSREHQDLQTPKDGRAGGQSWSCLQHFFAQAQALVQAMGP
jgi:hypothetical protein